MHNLESILLVTSVAVEKGKIGKRRLAKTLLQAASASHSYEAIPGFHEADAANVELKELSKEIGRRFGHLMIDK